MIGDAPANTENEVSKKRNYCDWKNTPYEQPTFWRKEIDRLKARPTPIPVHTFYIDNYAESNFREIAKETGGRCEALDIQSSSGAELLTQFVTEEILRKTAGENGDAAVNLYRNKFPTFTS